MRLQLIRYESVELTEQLMRERHAEGDCSDQPAQSECLQPGQESNGAGLPSTVAGDDISEGQEEEEEEEEDLDCGAEEREKEQDEQEEDGENVLMVMLKERSPEAQVVAEEDTVMRRLQDTAQQLGMEVV